MEVYKGLEKEFTLPSGYVVKIREQNAADDEILSQTDPKNPNARGEVLGNLNKFIATIVTYFSKTGKPYMTLEEVEDLRLRDKYYILLKSRIHSIGSEMDFKWGCSNEGCSGNPMNTNPNEKDVMFDVHDDLDRFDRDLSIKPLPEAKHEDAITPYENGTDEYINLTLSSNKEVRVKYLTPKIELNVLKLTKTMLNRNTELYARELSLMEGGEYKKLSDLSVLSKKDITEIRQYVKKMDSQFLLLKECECPYCGTGNIIPYTGVSDFFFPAEI